MRWGLPLFVLSLALRTTCRAAKTDWCPVEAERYGNDTRLGLKGKRIRCGALVYPPYSIYDEKTGAWAGFDMELFAEVAKRGQFEFEVVKLDDPPEGETYNDILFGFGRQLDMMCSWWGETAQRKSRSIEFTTPTVETSAILSTLVPRPTRPPFRKQFWTFLAPFSRDLWLVLLFGVLFSAIFLYIVDPKLEPATAEAGGRVAEPGSSDWNILKGVFNGINTMFYQGWMLFTVQELYRSPGNWMSKLYLMSWTGVCIVLVAAYTAQLTTFLIIELQAVSSINNLDDLTRSNQAACALVTVPAVVNFIRNQAPGLYVVPIKTIGEAFPAVREGKCGAALLGFSDAQLNIAVNTKCDMRIVGSPLDFRWMAGAFAADTSNCGGFVLRTVDVLLQSIREEGLMDDIWERYTRIPPECVGQSNPNADGTEDASLSIHSVGGLFIIHAAFCFIALIGYVVQRVRAARAAKGPQKDEVTSEFAPGSGEDPCSKSFGVLGRQKSAISNFHGKLFSAPSGTNLEDDSSEKGSFQENGSLERAAGKERRVNFSDSELPLVTRQGSIISSFHNKLFSAPSNADQEEDGNRRVQFKKEFSSLEHA